MAFLFNEVLHAQKGVKGNNKRGRPLTTDERKNYSGHFSEEVLDSARIYDGKVPWYLSKKFSGITRGNRIYFREGIYKPGTAAGVELIGHELVHVQQYQEGMNTFKYLMRSRKGYNNNPYEIEAYRRDDIIRSDFCSNNSGASGC